MGLLVLLAVGAAVLCLVGSAALLHALVYPPRKTFAGALAKGDPTDPADLGLAAQTLLLSLADGSETPAWLIDGHEPAGPTIVVVHGFGDSRYGALTWTPLLMPFASRLVLFDQRGHGEAEAKTSHQGTTEARDLLAVMEQIEPPAAFRSATCAQLGGEESAAVVLFGYSMGAGIAIAAAAAAPDRVRGVIADGSYRHWHEPVRCLLRCNRYPVQPILPLAGLGLHLFVKGRSHYDRARTAALLRCPLLMLHGTDDAMSPLESARQIAGAAPQGQLVTIEGGGHLDLARVAPVRYRDALTAFFGLLGAGDDSPRATPATRREIS